MKNLMKILSVLILICGIMAAVSVVMTSESGNHDFYVFCKNILYIFTVNIIFVVAIAICCYCLERNDTNYMTRIVPIYCMIPIVLTAIMVFFDLSKDDLNFFTNINLFFQSTSMWVLALSLIFVIKPNNQISKVIHYVSYGVIILNIILSLVVSTKATMVEKLPNVYNDDKYGGFNFATVEETESLASTIYKVTVVVELFAVLLLFTTNYAFSGKIELEVDDIDFVALKNEAESLTVNQMNNRYPVKKRDRKPIGQIEQQLPEDDHLDIVKNGPVKNDALSYTNATLDAVQVQQTSEQTAQQMAQQSIIANPTYSQEVPTTTPPTEPPQRKFLLDDDDINNNPNGGNFI